MTDDDIPDRYEPKRIQRFTYKTSLLPLSWYPDLVFLVPFSPRPLQRFHPSPNDQCHFSNPK